VRSLPALSLLCLGACTYSDHNLFAQVQEQGKIELTQGAGPADVEPISTLYVSRSGVYLFAVVPIVRADLETALLDLVESARRLGADGVSHIKVNYQPAELFKLTLTDWPFPWMQRINLTGEAWKRRK
jgi:hypothetical protein